MKYFLSGIKVVELAGLAPVPLCGMILSDFGARVIRVDNFRGNLRDEVLNRGKQSICIDLKQNRHVNIFKKLLKTADVLLDPYRPGVLENLNLSPIDLQKDNPRLIIARITGYGQPSSNDSSEVRKQKLSAGHDINYVAMSGLLSKLGGEDCPQSPLNIIGDFAGGALNCAFGVVLALFNRERTGQGEIIDCSMTLGSSYLSSFVWNSRHYLPFIWPQPNVRGANLLDGGAPFYRCYRTKDNKFVAVGAIEPEFYSCLLKLLEIRDSEAPQFDYENWRNLSSRFGEIFLRYSQKEWLEKASSCGDCCLTGVLGLDEAGTFWRESFVVGQDGFVEPRAQPVFLGNSRDDDEDDIHRAASRRPICGQHTEAVLREIGCDQEEIDNVMSFQISKAKL